jgi:hypothetical protein
MAKVGKERGECKEGVWGKQGIDWHAELFARLEQVTGIILNIKKLSAQIC